MHIRETEKPRRRIGAIQFGGGVFLLGFFDYMLQVANDAGVCEIDSVIVRSKTHGKDPLAEQNFLYTHVARGAEGSDIRLVNSIAKSVSVSEQWQEFLALGENPDLSLIVSNTTESGICFVSCPRPTDEAPESFPARLTALLYRRYQKGLKAPLILPCELIEENGKTLRAYALRHAEEWGLEEDFLSYLGFECDFRDTLVDRIVSGAPSDRIDLPYEDAHVNTSEYFHLWVIEGKPDRRIPFADAALNVKFVPDLREYRTLKVRILNGAHTSMIPYALLSGLSTVGECLGDEHMREYLKGCLFEEILPSLSFDESEAKDYAEQVLLRFSNPYLHHLCSAIALNSLSKFRVRVLPSILEYEQKTGEKPRRLLFSFGQLLRLYDSPLARDDAAVIASVKDRPTAEILADTTLWGRDLSAYVPEVDAARKAERF